MSKSTMKIDIVVDPSRLRPSDVEVLLGDATKFKKVTGWEPEIPYEDTMTDVLKYWRHRVSNSQKVRLPMNGDCTPVERVFAGLR